MFELVSVIIPVFNREKLIIKALQSVLEQTYNNIEIIVIDDGSTDSTRQQVETFQDKVRYFYKENGGVSSARNLGIQKAKGAFIAFLDSDDAFLPEKLLRQLQVFYEKPDTGIVLCDCIYINSQYEPIGRSHRREALPQDGLIINDILLAPSFIPSSVLLRRECFVEKGMFNENLKTAEDIEFFLRLGLDQRVVLIEEPLLYYMRGNPGLSELPITYDDYLGVVLDFVVRHSPRIPKAVQRKALYKAYLAFAKGKFWRKNIKGGVAGTINALRYSSNATDMFVVVKMFVAAVRSFLPRGIS